MHDASATRGTKPPSNTISQLRSTADTYNNRVQQTLVLTEASKYALDINTLVFNSRAFGTSRYSTTLNLPIDSSVSSGSISAYGVRASYPWHGSSICFNPGLISRGGQ